MAPKVCESCGEPVVEGVQFCTNCGFFLDWSDAGDGPAEGDAPAARPAPRAVTEAAPIAGADAPTDSQTVAAVDERPAPAAAQGSPQPVRPDRRPAPASRTAAPAGPPCPRCSTPNPASRRFCAKCGQFIGEPTATDQLRAFTPPKLRWWQRWLHGRPGSERAARAAYRRSLPWPVRMRRVLVVLAVLVLAFAYLRFVGRDPVSWARHRFDALRGTLVSVPDLTASSPRATTPVPGYPAKAAIDGRSDTAWATSFAGPERVTGSTCTAVADTNGLLLTAPGPVTVRAIKIHGGYPDKNAALRWRPKTIELWFPDGHCQRVNLADSPKPQQRKIHAVKTNAVRIAVVAGYPPEGGSTDPHTAITELALLMRPK
ncbi:MAG TPA: hypothetical protein VFU35_08985 [Jatrophihabitans sp.]|nr:hypothetical protein [Jatrophihabitans sp.]